MALSITGSVQATATTGTSKATGALNVSGTDFIVVAVCAEKAAGTTCSVTDVTASGLTFQKRWADTQNDAGSIPIRTEVWVAPIPGGAGAFNAAITVTLDNAVDGLCIHAFGVAGANINNTDFSFDDNSGLPYKGYVASGNASVNVTTDRANDILFAFNWMRSGGTNQPTGYTEIQASFTFATNFLRFKSAYKVVSVEQAAVALATQSTGEQKLFADAITADFTGELGNPAEAAAWWMLGP